MNKEINIAELKTNTLKAARKKYIERKILRNGSAVLACTAIIISAIIFIPSGTPSPDITTQTASFAKEVYVDEDVDKNEPLLMYSANNDVNTLADIYNSISGVRKIETLPVYEANNIEELSSRLLSELASGQGPDIICLSWDMGMIFDIRSMADMEYFSDMDKIINSHNDFSWADYNSTVMDAAILDGYRYFIPWQYNIPYLVSTEERFAKLGLDVPENFDMQAFLQLSDTFYTKSDVRSAMFSYYSDLIFFSDILQDGKIQMTEQNIEYFSAIRRAFQKHSGKDKIVSNDSIGISSFINSDALLYQYPYQSNIQEQLDLLETIRTETGSNKVVILPSPFNDEGVSKGYITDCFAINANSHLKNEAFDFIKFVLSDEIQKSSEYIRNIPVSNEAFNEQKQSVLYHKENKGTVELAEQLIAIYENTNDFDFRPVSIFAYINVITKNETLNRYMLGNESFEQMVDSVNADLEKIPFSKP